MPQARWRRGGAFRRSDRVRFRRHLWTLALGGVSWEDEADAAAGPSPRASHDATLAGDRLSLFGSLDDDGALAHLWALELPAP